MQDTLDALFTSFMGDDFFKDFIPPIFPVKTPVSYPMRFGWYHRHSTQNHEFWWGGTTPLVVVTDEYLMTMPESIIHEVGNALNAKGDDAYLD